MTSKKSQISVEQEALLWDEKILTLETSQGLIRAVIFYIIKCFGIFQGKELRQLKTDCVNFGADDTGKYVSLDLRNVVSAGRLIKRYDDPGNPRSVYKIFKKYCGYLANEGPLLVRPITSIKDYICYSPWPLGIAVIDQMVQTMMEEVGQNQNFGNVSVSLLAVNTLKNFGAGSHCIGTWVLRLFAMYIKLFQDEYRTCTAINCEEQSSDACLMISRVLDPPYPSDASELLKKMEKKERDVQKNSSERQETFNSWMTNIMSENEENTDKVYVKEEIISVEDEPQAQVSAKVSGSLAKGQLKNGKQKIPTPKMSKVKSLLSGGSLPESGKKLSSWGKNCEKNKAHSKADDAAKVNDVNVANIKTEPPDESSSELKIMTVLSITDSAFSVQVDEGETMKKRQDSGSRMEDSEKNGVSHGASVSNGRKRKRLDSNEQDCDVEAPEKKWSASSDEDPDPMEWEGKEGVGESVTKENKSEENGSDSDDGSNCLVIAHVDSPAAQTDSDIKKVDLCEPEGSNTFDGGTPDQTRSAGSTVSDTDKGNDSPRVVSSATSESSNVESKPKSKSNQLPPPDTKKDSIHILRNLLLQQRVENNSSETSAAGCHDDRALDNDGEAHNVDDAEGGDSDFSCSSPPVLSPQAALPSDAESKQEGQNTPVTKQQASESPSKALDIVKFLDTAQLQMQNLLQSSLTDKVDLFKSKEGGDESVSASRTLSPAAKSAEQPQKSELFSARRSIAKSRKDSSQECQFAQSSVSESSSSLSQKSCSTPSDSDVHCPLLRSVLQGQTSPLDLPGRVGSTDESSTASDGSTKSSRSPGSKLPLQLQTQQALTRAEKRDQSLLVAHAERRSQLRAYLSSTQEGVGSKVLSPSKMPGSLKNLKHHSSQSSKVRGSETSLLSQTQSSSSSSSSNPSLMSSLFQSVSSGAKKKNTGVYQYLSNHTEKAVYQTLQVNSKDDSHTFSMADLPWSCSPGRQSRAANSIHSSTTSEINVGDYFPSGTVIPASSLRLLTRQGPRGMEMVLKFDYSCHGNSGSADCDMSSQAEEEGGDDVSIGGQTTRREHS
ncbi:mediator of RNA polymerase II transcription subunit 1 [Aplysia californica]|uniref:Mediator of RNA polymerase II transcription subunit 1 n=1 Tax=Aplysia californica TaxID=6500 RepID=A0ABM0JWN5_APLCA|nr:mediator of RNA polymerase II transcription subunit 1 [Aplysia californica]